MNYISKGRTALFLAACLFLLFSCNNGSENIIKDVFRFKIGYGKEELAMIAGEKSHNDELINLYYKRGFYYISDRSNNKILKLTEKGEPILTIYNGESYPNLAETSSGDGSDDGVIYIKVFKEFPLYSPGHIAADINKNIYIVNKDPDYKKLISGKIYSEMVVKFGAKGDFLYKLGREGIDGAPFGYILKMVTDSSDNLLVVERIVEGIEVYKFSPAGELLKKSVITIRNIPITKDEGDYIVDFIDFIPGYIEDEIYVTCQFINMEESALSLAKYDTQYEKLFKFSLKSDKFEHLILKLSPEFIDLKREESEVIKELYGNSEKVMKPLESLVGIDESRRIYLWQKELPLKTLTEDRFKVNIYLPNSKTIGTPDLELPYDIEYRSRPILSPEGKLILYYVRGGEVHFANINY